ncbi:DUF5708 family protein [Actinomadura macrotermitis]|uniref:Uncharacterized protein n=1 Tax=Actinomadura macrotermitis TaxID=2585200 RepID=A0A7K0C2C8_9ACTN|nr:DUF5708 family protein [Actinomadura macrotermitis]MQY07282.1 hypothetical protein [Actinomadura macrotermitis]
MREFIVGAVFTVAGLVLWLAARGVDTPVVSLHKVGLVVAVISGAETLWALWTMLRRSAGPPEAGRRR